eukprot:Polyplicarium_translucidae@DN3037_c0_g2_i5.p1
MRRIAGLLYKKNKRFAQSIALSKQDKHFKDAMECARDSGDSATCEALLQYFVDIADKECFAACLCVCYDFVKPDVALEQSWKNGYMDQCMPYLIQVMREQTAKVEQLEKRLSARESEAEKEKSAPNDYVPPYMIGGPGGFGGMGNLALMPPGPQQPPPGAHSSIYGQPPNLF